MGSFPIIVSKSVVFVKFLCVNTLSILSSLTAALHDVALTPNFNPLALWEPGSLHVPPLPFSAPPSPFLFSVSLQASQVESNSRKDDTINSRDDERDASIKDNAAFEVVE